MTSINWYPGHMKKTKDMMKDNIKLIDVILEVVDARVPISSKNPEIALTAKDKVRIILINKADLVEKKEIEHWKEYFKKNNLANEVMEISARTGLNINRITNCIESIKIPRVERLKAKGVLSVPIRIMVAGIPNVGKSQVINRIVGKRATGVGNRPGFTKGKQWVRIKEGIELLDTPGILWPRFESEEVGIRLAITGAIKEEILDSEYVAASFIDILKINKKHGEFLKKYKLEEADMEKNSHDIIRKIASNFGMFLKHETEDMLKASLLIVRDYRDMKLGKFGIDNEEICNAEVVVPIN